MVKKKRKVKFRLFFFPLKQTVLVNEHGIPTSQGGMKTDFKFKVNRNFVVSIESYTD